MEKETEQTQERQGRYDDDSGRDDDDLSRCRRRRKPNNCHKNLLVDGKNRVIDSDEASEDRDHDRGQKGRKHARK